MRIASRLIFVVTFRLNLILNRIWEEDCVPLSIRRLRHIDYRVFQKIHKRHWIAVFDRAERMSLRSFLNKQAYVTGFQPSVFVRSVLALPTYVRDIRSYQKKNNLKSFKIRLKDAFPILTDMKVDAGTTAGHYFHQDLWAARKIFAAHPAEHLDVGSRIDGFIGHLLVFMPVTVVDIRPLTSEVTGLSFFQDDASELSNLLDNSVRSLSTLHTAEHFGLGRYTDPVDPLACFKFMASLQRVLAPGGRLYFSVPVGRERVEFNAHRVFDPPTILRSFSTLDLVSFSYVGDDDLLYEDCDPLRLPPSEMACGLFEFTKRSI